MTNKKEFKQNYNCTLGNDLNKTNNKNRKREGWVRVLSTSGMVSILSWEPPLLDLLTAKPHDHFYCSQGRSILSLWINKTLCFVATFTHCIEKKKARKKWTKRGHKSKRQKRKMRKTTVASCLFQVPCHVFAERHWIFSFSFVSVVFLANAFQEMTGIVSCVLWFLAISTGKNVHITVQRSGRIFCTYLD